MKNMNEVYEKAQKALEQGRQAISMLNDPKEEAWLKALDENAASVERLCKGPMARFQSNDKLIMDYATKSLRYAQDIARRKGIDLGELA